MSDANPTIRFDLLRKLNAFVQSIPERMFYLDAVIDQDPIEGEPTVLANGEVNQQCGAIACAMGWAGLHPDFHKLGLRWDSGEQDLLLNERIIDYNEAAAELFGIDLDKANNLFGMVECSKYDPPRAGEMNPVTGGFREDSPLHQHRKLLQLRMEQFFAEHGEVL